MGGVLSTVVDLIVLAIDISSATGLTMEALLTGEALASLEAEVFSLMTLEGLSGIEALAQLGWSAEQFSQLSLLASTYSQAIGYGVFFQTVLGLSTLIQAGIRIGLDVSTVHRNVLASELQRMFGNIANTLHINLSHQFNPLDWCASLHDNFPEGLENVDITFLSRFAQVLEHSRWVRQQTFTTNPELESGDVIEFYGPPGGANQRSTPDWLLHLILRLNGAEEATPFCRNMSTLS